MLEHGGKLRAAARRWNIPLADWLDLSTGIAPRPYPVPAVPAEVWQRLPEDDDGLEAAACDYYGARHLLPMSGSQAAIQMLPRLFAPGRVAIPAPIYNEHPGAWQVAGHTRVGWGDPSDYAVVCNPTNPTGQRYSRTELMERARRVRLLVVDEAFLDAEPEASLIGGGADNVVVLRSLGKFFGLAGVRVGFVFAAPELLRRMQEAMGPWAVSGPSREAARLALADTAWQAAARPQLQAAGERLRHLLAPLGEVKATALFATLSSPHSNELFDYLARRAILTRRFDQQPLLRCGLPANEAGWQRLATALNEWKPA